MKKINQKGFSVIELCIVILVIGLLAFIGYRVYDSRQKKTDTTPTSQSTVKNDETKTETKLESDETKDWLIYTSTKKSFKIAVPDGWNLEAGTDLEDIFAWEAKDIVYKAGTRAKVTDQPGGRDGSSIAFHLIYDYKTNEGIYQSPALQKVKESTVSNGVEVTKYTRTQTTEPEGMDIPKGTVEYVYDISKDSKLIRIIHHVKEGEIDQSARIEQMIATVEFL